MAWVLPPEEGEIIVGGRHYTVSDRNVVDELDAWPPAAVVQFVSPNGADVRVELLGKPSYDAGLERAQVADVFVDGVNVGNWDMPNRVSDEVLRRLLNTMSNDFKFLQEQGEARRQVATDEAARDALRRL